MNDILERLSGRLTMYRLVSIALGSIWIFAFFLACIGGLAYSPLALAAPLGVLLAVCYGTNGLLGWAYGIKPHGESVFITSLLLACICTPTITPAKLAAIGLAGAFAMTSKYVLAVRGKHVFNPAAFGAFAIGLTGLAHGTWWIANPSLLALTLLAAFLVAYKTRRFALVGAFLAVSVPLVVLHGLLQHQSLGSSLGSLVSWPLVFLAGFMLTEPLTLAPRRWQQLTIAVLVGVLVALPFSLGPLSTTPQLSLLVGNLIAFWFGTRRAVWLRFVGSTNLSSVHTAFHFTPLQPVRFLPGQYAELHLPHAHADSRGLRRSFSIASSPTEHVITFATRLSTTGSSFKRALKTLEPGAVIRATTIAGDFVLPRNAQQPLLFIAGGVGITPFISQLRWLQATREQRDIVLLYFIRSGHEAPYRDELTGLNIRVLYIETPALRAGELQQLVPDAARRTAYISGPPPLVHHMRAQLRAMGSRHIHTDYFTGY